MRHGDGIQGFTQCSDLIDLDENGIRNALIDAARQAFGIGDKQIISNKLAASA